MYNIESNMVIGSFYWGPENNLLIKTILYVVALTYKLHSFI